jgi:anti-sigma B factor antagonist/stage II sporulation protein AA (anti-sigma F factor antagonist)
MTELEIDVEDVGAGVVATLIGDVDLANAAPLRDRLLAAVPNTAWALVVDLARLTYLDSSGVRLLFDLAARLGERRQHLILLAAPDTLHREVLRLVAMDRVATVVDTRADALARLDEVRREQAR